MNTTNENARVAAGGSENNTGNDGIAKNSKTGKATQSRPVLRLRKPPLAAVDYVRQRCARWPLVIHAHRYLALLAKRDGLPFTAAQIEVALAEIVNSTEYLRALIADRKRYLPSGFPHGFVSEKAKQHAVERLAKIQVTK